MTDRLVIVGAGGHGREALAIARAVNRDRDRWHVIGLVDDGAPDNLVPVDDANLLGTTDFLIDHGDAAPAIALVDPSAWLGDDVDLAEGVIVHPGAICTTNVRVGLHSHVNCGVIVSHDCRIGDFVSLSPGVKLNGAVTVGDGAFLGTGAIVLPGRSIGQDAVVGAGAVVIDDVAPGATVVGVPAR